MPIKFRCSHCNQFLGISRSQTGGIVDCPACGRSIRVPNLDGTVSPLPRPSIDLKDNTLASALDALAELAPERTVTPETPPPGRGERPPIELNAGAPPVIIALPVAPIQASVSSAPARGAEEPALPWIEADEQVAGLAGSAPISTSSRPVFPVSRRDLLIATISAASVAPITWWLARRGTTTLKDRSPDSELARAAVPPPPDNPPPESVPALTGRITYVTADGESRPDAGSRVLLFPENRQGSTLLAVDGFRANAAAADLQLARESMKLYGGAFVIADEQGHYAANLSSSGTYEMLIISNYQSRPAGPLPPDLLKALGRYFDRPQQLIGQTAYEFAHLRLTGREPAVRDQVFQRV